MLKRGLGRGLGALIGDDPAERGAVKEIEISLIRPNPDQPRKNFDREKLEELAGSIREHGVVQPVVVRRQGEHYELVAGERRWRAASLAGLKTVPAVVKDLTEAQTMEIALIENLQREDLNPVEEAEAYRRLIQEFGLTQEDLARRLGKSRPQISNTLRLLGLSRPVLELVGSGRLSMGHAKVIMGLEDPDRQTEIARRIAETGASVRQAEELVKSVAAPGAPRSKGSARLTKDAPAAVGRDGARDPEVIRLEKELRELLGTPVSILPGQPKGRIEIVFFGEEDLARITDILVGAERGETV